MAAYRLKLAAGFTAVACIVLTGVLSFGQASVGSALPEFEVATVKPADPSGGPVGAFTYPGGRVVLRQFTLQYLVVEAFQVQRYQIEGGPVWITGDRFDIEAKPSDASPSSKSNPTSIKTPLNSEQRLMLQSLLMDRFQLKYHRGLKASPTYILERGDKPLSLRAPKDKDAFPWAGGLEGGTISRGSGMAGTNISMSQLATRLSMFLGRPVLDQTGLAGSFDFDFRTGDDDPDSDVTTGIIASMRGIGLRLRVGRGPLDTITIDHVEKPSPN
ncbi:MAG TPA: TIGR03435 family protein [Acidobacteriaceae bacterium]|jgi:uncharacterized protein (TIGR03435 family)